MMLAIQALKDENEKLKSKLDNQEEQLEKQEKLLTEILKKLE